MKKRANAFILRKILIYTKPYQKTMIGVSFLTIILAFLSPIVPILFQKAVDDPIINGNIVSLSYYMIAILCIITLQAILQYVYAYYSNVLGQNVIRDMRKHLFEHLTYLNVKYFDNTPIGTLITRVISDLETIADVFEAGLLMMISDVLKIIVIFAIMWYSSWELTLIAMVVLPFLLLAGWFFKEGTKKSFQEVRSRVAQLNTFLQEHITGMYVVQIFNREIEEYKRFQTINTQHQNAHIKSVFYYSVFFPVVEIISAMAIGLIIWYGSKGILQEKFTFGLILAFVMYIGQLFQPIRNLADRFNTLQMGVVSGQRFFDILDTQQVTENTGKSIFEGLRQDITFQDVWFAYKNEDWVLKGISFQLKKGQTLALVGSTGAGKSSIINLLNRFYDIQKGDILIDSIPIKNYELKSLRKNMAVVLQDVFLYSDTILENIRLYDKNILLEQVIETAKTIGIHDFIMSLPGNYAYNVQERGATLSVGQRQLIAFARAMVRNPQILILDEATASIDTESELLIQQAIEKMMQNRTCIIIAHRLSTIQHAHHIIVLERGNIIEQGNHESLMQKRGRYYQLYQYHRYR
ncbi:MAG: ABC transporter ATP-binding protein/permease [Bacteroidia bacterium]|nr:ABC transporter ATP-binding protein/permease [Bacteroidia bacterium]MDW8347665.1 ABC transporter ATP-binding protein [Bacteroidia bacterium]